MSRGAIPSLLRSFPRLLRQSFVRTASSLTLRPYQEECIQTCLDAVDKGQRRIAVSLATGGGKTVIFSHLIDKIKGSGARSQTLILVHRRELVEQAANHCRKTCTGSSVELEMGIHEASGNADITVCSLQSLLRRLDKYDKNRVKLIIIDEAHHAAAKTYLRVLEYFNAVSAASPTVVVGFSATLFRRDGLHLASVFDEIVFHKDYISMMKDQYLCPAKFTCVKLENVSLRGLKLSGADGDFAVGQLASQVNTVEANNAAVRAWIDRAKDRKSTIVFAVDIQHVIDLTECFRAHGVDARAVTSRNDKRERSDLVAAFRSGEYPVLVNCGIFTEGFDSPNIDCVLLNRPTKSVGLLVQMIGRGMRLSQGKQDCHILDMTSCLDVGVASVPTLFGLDPNDLTDQDLTLEEMEAKAKLAAERALLSEQHNANKSEVQESANPPPTQVSYLDYDDMEDLMKDHATRGVRHVSRLSPLNWIQIDPSKYILALGNKGFIRISLNEEDSSDAWTGTYTQKLPKEADARLSRPKVLFDQVDSLERAIAACDTAALNLAPRTIIVRNAEWRLQEASDRQKQYMLRLGSKDVSGFVTRGHAQDFITRCMHGGKASIVKANKERKAAFRLETKQYKEQQLREAKAAKEVERMAKRDRIVNKEVAVGPLVS